MAAFPAYAAGRDSAVNKIFIVISLHSTVPVLWSALGRESVARGIEMRRIPGKASPGSVPALHNSEWQSGGLTEGLLRHRHGCIQGQL